ncbi:MAG: hypothetical protein AMS27_03500 [Bacteroides sp. SM23_62_1]|nr:MAG: hypothetical protein AMS27_03500 [Bacteroides sp. SM23_62_1]
MLIYIATFAIQMLFWLLIYARIIFYHPASLKIRKTPVSVIICARNEEQNLRKNLPLILNQQYADFEVVVINDCSNDGTEDFLNELTREYSFLKTTTIKEDKKFRHGKKLALTIGIKSASHEWLLLTDADCRPESEYWIDRMQRNFTSGTSIVLGYGGFYTHKGLLNIIIRFDTLYIAMQYFSYALAGLPYMGVGRNLAYRKELFFNNKGFASHSHLASGDDDLFVNETATAKNTRIELRPESHTRSEPKQSWADWYYQKKRHLTTGPRYKPLIKFLLGFENLTRILFYSLFLYLAIKATWIMVILGLFIIRLTILLSFFKIMSLRLNEKHLLVPSPILDFLLPFLNIFILFSNYVEARRRRWK